MQGNYYAIIPAKVRHDKNLKPIAKLLFSEITALSNTKGYAYPTNAYLAEIYDVSTRTISAYLKQLEDNGYIKIEIQRSSKGTYRYIHPCMDMSSNFMGGRSTLHEGVKEISNGGEGDFHTKEYYKNNTINKYYKKREGKKEKPSLLENDNPKDSKEKKPKEKSSAKKEKVGIPSPDYPATFSQELITACEAYFEHRKQIGQPFSSKNAKQTKVLQTSAQVAEYGETKVIASFYEAITEGWKMNYVRKEDPKNKSKRKQPKQAKKREVDGVLMSKLDGLKSRGIITYSRMEEILSWDSDEEISKEVDKLMQKPQQL